MATKTRKSCLSPATNWKIQFVAVRHGDEPKNPVCRHNSWRQMRNCQLLAINYPFFREIPKNIGFSTPKINNFLFVAISYGDELDFLVRHCSSRRRTVISSSSSATNKIFAFGSPFLKNLKWTKDLAKSAKSLVPLKKISPRQIKTIKSTLAVKALGIGPLSLPTTAVRITGINGGGFKETWCKKATSSYEAIDNYINVIISVEVEEYCPCFHQYW